MLEHWWFYQTSRKYRQAIPLWWEINAIPPYIMRNKGESLKDVVYSSLISYGYEWHEFSEVWSRTHVRS